MRTVGHHAVEEFRYPAQASVAQVRIERTDEYPSKVLTRRIVFEVCGNELPKQPCPGHAAVAGLEALVQASLGTALELVMARVEGAESVCSVELVPAEAHHILCHIRR